MRWSRSAHARGGVLAALATLGAAGACNYDFDEFNGLGPPVLDSGAPTAGGAAGATRADSGGSGMAGSSGGAAPDARVTTGAGGAGATGGASGGSAGSSGATGSGGAAGTGAGGGAGATAGSSGSAGAAGQGGSGGSAGTSGAGGSAGTGGSTVDASVDGAGGTGAGGTGTGTGTGTGGTAGTAMGGAAGAGTAMGGTAGAGGTSAGGAAGMGGAGAGGAGTAGTDGGTPPPPDGGTRPDIRIADISLDRVAPPFDCASVGGRVYGNHCYWAVTTPVTWEVGSQQSCPAPAHLATITSAGEDTFVVSFLTDESRWVGLRRPADSPKNTSAFVWVTGETSTYSHWYTANGEPDYDGECVRLGPSNNWGDNPCSAAFPVVCERE